MLINFRPSTIAANGTVGSAVNIAALAEKSMALAAISLTTGYTQSSISFEASFDGGTTWLPVIKTDGSALTYSCTGSTAEAIAVPPTDLCGFPMIRPVAPVAIVAGAVLGFHFRVV